MDYYNCEMVLPQILVEPWLIEGSEMSIFWTILLFSFPSFSRKLIFIWIFHFLAFAVFIGHTTLGLECIKMRNNSTFVSQKIEQRTFKLGQSVKHSFLLVLKERPSLVDQ